MSRDTNVCDVITLLHPSSRRVVQCSFICLQLTGLEDSFFLNGETNEARKSENKDISAHFNSLLVTVQKFPGRCLIVSLHPKCICCSS